MNRFVTATVIAAMAASGCSITTKQGKTAAIAAGAALAATGVLLTAGMIGGEPDDSNGDGIDAWPEDGEIACVFGGCVLSVGMAIGGVVLLMTGIAADPETDDAPPAPLPVAVAPAAPTLPLVPPLPEVATDEATMQLAKQARGAALAANCSAVRVLLRDIETRDQRYHLALLASPVIDGCR